ncbi:MAG: putative Pachytene checkpoint protein 2, partial [Streblomastix strix]
VGLKRRLLNYVKSALLFSERGVNPHIIGCNRLVLLHGPPGTGKTSLARALAHKLSIRMGKIYASGGMLLEINAHSLFSKWFSESGKLVMKLFQHIQEIVEDEELFVVLLIDEVESLSASRQNAMSGSEPTDAIRVVNALLTQIDALKTKKNVLIITTSNITQAIDAAFLDRADIRQFIGHPIAAGRYSIFASCVSELVRTGIISVEEEQSKDKAIQKDQEVKQEDGQRKGKSKQSSSQSKQKTQSHSRPNSS